MCIIFHLSKTYRANLPCILFFQLRIMRIFLLSCFNAIVFLLLVLRLTCHLEVTPVLEFSLLFLECRSIFLDSDFDFRVSLLFFFFLLFSENGNLKKVKSYTESGYTYATSMSWMWWNRIHFQHINKSFGL